MPSFLLCMFRFIESRSRHKAPSRFLRFIQPSRRGLYLSASYMPLHRVPPSLHARAPRVRLHAFPSRLSRVRRSYYTLRTTYGRKSCRKVRKGSPFLGCTLHRMKRQVHATCETPTWTEVQTWYLVVKLRAKLLLSVTRRDTCKARAPDHMFIVRDIPRSPLPSSTVRAACSTRLLCYGLFSFIYIASFFLQDSFYMYYITLFINYSKS